MIRNKKLAIWGSIFLTVSIVLGALGAHAMRSWLQEDQLRGFLTATDYLTIHGLGFLILSMMRAEISKPTKVIRYGVLIFSGSIYILSIMNAAKVSIPSLIGLITPIGGIIMIAGWIWVTVSISQSKEHKGSGS